MNESESPGETGASTKENVNKRLPKLFKVFMHNDDYTTMEFVVLMLETVFHKISTEANVIMLKIHVKGVGLCGIYPFEIAETMVNKVHSRAREEGFPLKCTIEEN